MSRNYFSEIIRKVCAETGVKKFVPHQLRHSACTAVVDEAGVGVAQQLLGHADEQMTRRHSRMAIDQAIRGTAVLSRRFAGIVNSVN